MDTNERECLADGCGAVGSYGAFLEELKDPKKQTGSFAALNERDQLQQFLPGFLDADFDPLAR